MPELQRIVDQLALRTGCGVALNDCGGRILAYSAHQGPVDDARNEAILARSVPSPRMEITRTLGLARSPVPVRVPPQPDLGMLSPRICGPIRFEGAVLGYLWLVDKEPPLNDEDLTTIAAAADECGGVIRRNQLMEEVERSRSEGLLRDLLSDTDDLRAEAADQLIDTEALTPAAWTVAISAHPFRQRQAMTRDDAALRPIIETALDRAQAQCPTNHCLTLMRPGHGLLLLTTDDVNSEAGGASWKTATALHDSLSAGLSNAGQSQPAGEWSCTVGIGDLQAGLNQLHISYDQAQRAATASGLMPSLGPVTTWANLGVYRTLLELPLDRLRASSLPSGLIELMNDSRATLWITTLETYLDLGCDARATADLLGLRRGSVYHRLHRIEEIAGVNLATSGSDRLALHLGLKVARLTNLLPQALGEPS